MLGLHKRASDFKVHYDTVVISVPVSTLKWVSTLCSFSVTVKGKVFSEFKTPRNAVSRLSSSALHGCYRLSETLGAEVTFSVVTSSCLDWTSSPLRWYFPQCLHWSWLSTALHLFLLFLLCVMWMIHVKWVIHVFYFIYFLWLTSSLFISVQVLPGEYIKHYKVIA